MNNLIINNQVRIKYIIIKALTNKLKRTEKVKKWK